MGRVLFLGTFYVLGAWLCSGAPLQSYNLPQEFQQKLDRRASIDRYQSGHYATEEKLDAVPYQPIAKRAQERRGTIRALHSKWDEGVAKYRTSLKETIVPLRGYRTPLLQNQTETWPVTLEGETNTKVLESAQWVQDRLAYDGLLPTLATVLEKLNCAESAPECSRQLRAAGFPVDLVQFFRIQDQDGTTVSGEAILGWIGKAFKAGRTVESIRADLRKASFVFQPTLPGFRLSVEDGSSSIELLRMQVGGGYSGGILPGSSLDFAGKLVEVMSEAKVLMSIQETYFEPCHWLAAHAWPLRRVGQLTIIGEPMRVTAWAQDNGKPGYVRVEGSRTNRLVAITPRFASHEDGESVFVPGESFLMEGVKAAGLEVVQSPLLYQGGDLVAVTDPRTGKRVLLLGEGELHRNTPLGLTREQVLEAFRVEMNVDECVIWPEGSFHLDYDVTFRRMDGRSIAFVNEPSAAARIIVEQGLAALEKAQVLSLESSRALHRQLQEGRHAKMMESLEPVLKEHQTADGKFRTRLVKPFAQDPVDSATANFQCFLTALDYLCAQDPEFSTVKMAPERVAYLQSLQAIGRSLGTQKALLQARGWEVTPVPSMPDLNRSVNYLNGLQDKGRYVMPAWGGLYRELDLAAAAAFRQALGARVEIVPIQCAESQVKHGSIHCMVKAYPAGD